jgi:mannose-1-phosphate guanylyltransferase/phosphomannomutase
MIAGLNATGVSVRDLRVASPSLSRFDLRRGDVAGSIHVRISPESPEEVEILFAEPPGVPISAKTERSIENYFHREDFRRASYEEMGTISFPPRVVETYQETLLDTWDTESIARSGFRAVIDYNYSPASLVSGGILDRAGVEGIGLNAYATDKAALLVTPGGPEAREKVKRLVAAVGADLGVLFDPSAESLALLDERGEPVPDATLLLLLLGHACRTQGPGRVVLPLHITRQAEHAAEHCGATVVRTRVSEASLMAEAAQPGTIFAGMLGGRYVFPTFVSSPDALFAFGKVLELMAHSGKSLSELQAEMPQVHLQHAEVPCPWHLKGSVMRFMIEEVKGERVSLVDGIKITVGDGDWVQILPDADDPVFHVYAESGDPEGAARLVETYTARLHVVVASREGTEV